MKNFLAILTFIFLLIGFVSCDPENVINNNTEVNPESDYEWDSTKVVNITLNETSISVNGTGATVEGSKVTITSSGNYKISGSLTDGQIIVNTKGRVRLILNNANVSNSKTSPLYVINADKTILILPNGSNNTFTDATSYEVTADSLNATIFSKDYLAIFGTGSLTVNANYDAGIKGKDELIIKSGIVNVNSVGTGISGKDYLKIYNGTITVNSGGDGLKSDNDSNDSLGYVDIEKGTFTITAANDGISAETNLKIADGTFNITSGGGNSITPGLTSTKGLKAGKEVTISGGTYKINSSDKSISSDKDITINAGTFSISSGDKAIHCDSNLIINDGKITITKAEKGLGAHYLILNNGEIIVNSTNDCIKASAGSTSDLVDGSIVRINGGTVLLSTTKGDGVDSNGDINISSGTIVIQGSASSSDYAITSKGKYIISGGFLISTGGNMLVPDLTSTQNSVLIKFNTALTSATTLNLQDSNKNSILTYKPSRNALYAVFSSPELVNGNTYTVYTGGSSTGTPKNGLYTDGMYSGGIVKGSFAIASLVTNVSF